MKKRVVALALALRLPLALYGVPYTYALTTQSTYGVRTSLAIGSGVTSEVKIRCLSFSDSTEHYSVSAPQFRVDLVELLTSTGTFGSTSDTPNGWDLFLTNTAGSATVDVFIICESPITVAGIGVPEFGSLYTAVALGAILFFFLSRYMSAKKPISTPAATTLS